MTDDCSICLEEMTFGTTITTVCGHLFHFACFIHLGASGATACPNCRMQVFEPIAEDYSDGYTEDDSEDDSEDDYDEQEGIEVIREIFAIVREAERNEAERNEADEFSVIERLIRVESEAFESYIEALQLQESIFNMY
jgi:hypothetical protein